VGREGGRVAGRRGGIVCMRLGRVGQGTIGEPSFHSVPCWDALSVLATQRSSCWGQALLGVDVDVIHSLEHVLHVRCRWGRSRAWALGIGSVASLHALQASRAAD
jgi:hypothetical protein